MLLTSKKQTIVSIQDEDQQNISQTKEDDIEENNPKQNVNTN